MLFHTTIAPIEKQMLLARNDHDITNRLFFQQFSKLRVLPVDFIRSRSTRLEIIVNSVGVPAGAAKQTLKPVRRIGTNDFR